jgi:predicted DCC family thiol-disulfide oxidoreductase YuxK
VITETTKIMAAEKPLVIYDGTCGLCAGNLKWLHRLDWLGAFDDAPYQADEIYQRFPRIKRADCEEALHLAFPNGKVYRGADALRKVMLRMPLTLFAGLLLSLPPFPYFFRRLYPVMARNRYRFGGHCELKAPRNTGIAPPPTTGSAMGWLPLMGMTGSALLLRDRLPDWGFMWVLALAIFAGFKWWTWWRVKEKGIRPGLDKVLAYLMLWPGMDARAFLEPRTALEALGGVEWFTATGKVLFGAILFWGVARGVVSQHPLLGGWIGMTGMIFLLHFGLFHVTSLYWRRAGVQADPLMRAPHLSHSLGDFWGRRWNSAFRHLSHDLVFQPLSKRLGVRAAMFVTFLLSGLVHDLVISLPAGGGYGFPTLYFTLQGAGLALEHSSLGRKLGLNGGAAGWAFALLVTVGPAYFLFHPIFITRVILPGMRALGAL